MKSFSKSSKSDSLCRLKKLALPKNNAESKSSNHSKKRPVSIFPFIQNENSESAKVQNKIKYESSIYSKAIAKEQGRVRRSTLHLIKDRKKNIEILKEFRPITSRNKRRQILKSHSVIERISKCNSKVELVKIFSELTSKWKRLIKNYMERCFLIHLHLRQIKDFSELMQQRQNIYDALDDPFILEDRVRLANNLVKNFCKGLTSFLVIFYQQLTRDGWLSPCGSRAAQTPQRPDSGKS